MKFARILVPATIFVASQETTPSELWHHGSLARGLTMTVVTAGIIYLSRKPIMSRYKRGLRLMALGGALNTSGILLWGYVADPYVITLGANHLAAIDIGDILFATGCFLVIRQAIAWSYRKRRNESLYRKVLKSEEVSA